MSKLKTMLINAAAENLVKHPQGRDAHITKSQALQATRSALHSISEQTFRKFLTAIVPEERISREDWIRLSRENQQLKHFISQCCGESVAKYKSIEDLMSPHAVSPIILEPVEIL